MKVLIADDDEVTRTLVQLSLERAGYEVMVTCDGEEALAALKADDTIRIVVSDWEMPRLNGVELCQQVRAFRHNDYTYFILLTAVHTDDDHYYQAMEDGVDDFLLKTMATKTLRLRLKVAERILGFTRQINQLKELLPICCYCKRIRDDNDYWQQIDEYIHDQTGTDFSHGICPNCYDSRVKPMLDRLLPPKPSDPAQ
ncbi:MAG TPA: response regulator [Acidobacteriota bacterium]|nr:response regulator [Acidobacteriota bacterium]HMZ80327.1 response regulator [Acidobacteriota bacterium]HNB73895.1 response regulator [Acidobacteriota bacterium]HNC43916.1 response regulator [Acidobacteriota bacterium]HND18254.1 response regulator [Acidobacteriota bacterium]